MGIVNDIPLNPGPFEDILDPTPQIGPGTVLPATAQLGYGPLAAELSGLGPDLDALENNVAGLESEANDTVVALEQIETTAGQANFTAEIAELEAAELALPAGDAALNNLAALNPAGQSLPPVSFTTPELESVLFELQIGLNEWDSAWPLWPFAL